MRHELHRVYLQRSTISPSLSHPMEEGVRRTGEGLREQHAGFGIIAPLPALISQTILCNFEQFLSTFCPWLFRITCVKGGVTVYEQTDRLR